MLSCLLNIFNQIEMKVTGLQIIITFHKIVKKHSKDRLRPWIFSRNILFLYSLTSSIFEYLLITYFSITKTLSFLIRCILTLIIQQRNDLIFFNS